MSVWDILKKPKPVPAVELLQQISKRAEHLTPDEQAKSFVAIRRIEGALKSRDSRIIFGRRGTGKTHILSYVASAVDASGDVSILIDLRTLGSNGSIYSNQNLSEADRATHLMRDLISALHEKLTDKYTQPQSHFKGRGLDVAVEKLADAVKTVIVSEVREIRDFAAKRSDSSSDLSSHLNISAIDAQGGVKFGLANSQGSEQQTGVTVTGGTKLSINLGDTAKIIADICERFTGRIWLLLDEWSSLPLELQPYLADFVRRALLPVQKFTVHIAAIEYRSQFRIDHGTTRIGLELGSDISADINLDDYFIYDVDPATAVEFFKKLLFSHLQAFSKDFGLVEKNSEQVISSIFSQDRVFAELVRASEGVARDFINILQLAAMRSDQAKLSMNEVRSASKDWFERDKQRNLDINRRAQSLLEWIRDKVIYGKKARAFLLRTDSNDESIDFLFDERMLHIAKRSYSAQGEPGVRYKVWKVDYGCYVDLINTVKSPTGFLFENIEINDAGEITVPDDDLRSVRRAVLSLEEFEKNFQA